MTTFVCDGNFGLTAPVFVHIMAPFVGCSGRTVL